MIAEAKPGCPVDRGRSLLEVVRLYAARGISSDNLTFLSLVMAVVLGMGLWHWQSRNNPPGPGRLALAALASAVPVWLLCVRSFTRWIDFTDLLTRSSDRATLPGIFLSVAATRLLVGRRQASLAAVRLSGSPGQDPALLPGP